MKLAQYIENPNLPKFPVSLCAVSSEAPQIISALCNLNIQCILVKPLDTLMLPVASHPDMQIHHLGGNRVVISKDNYMLNNQLSDFGFSVETEESFRPQYPYDVPLNAARVGDVCLCNTKYVSHAIKDYFEKNQIQLCHVAQGYSKCSTCIINETSIITSDPSIYDSAKNIGLDVLLISSGQIDLPGYDTGFLGGCAFKVSRNLLAFTGDVSLHSDYPQIRSFLLKHNIDYISLTKKRLFDIGGMLPLMEFTEPLI